MIYLLNSNIKLLIPIISWKHKANTNIYRTKSKRLVLKLLQPHQHY